MHVTKVLVMHSAAQFITHPPSIVAPTLMQGTRKPAPEAYQAVTGTLNKPASDLLFVDDRQVNVDAALAFGMDAVRFESAAQLEEQLHMRGLQF